MNLHKTLLRTRKCLELPPLPEEMLGVRSPDPIDIRDRKKLPIEGPKKSLSGPFSRAVLRSRHQGRTNRCGGFTGQALLEIRHQKVLGGVHHYSANEVYWNARIDKHEDSGVFLRDLMKALQKRGSVSEHVWKSRDNFNKRPDEVEQAERLKIESYERMSFDLDDWLQVLSVENLPIVIGFKVYRKAAREAQRTGTWPVPRDSDKLDGYHAVLLGEHKTSKSYGRMFKIWNSWGPTPIGNACQWMPKQYITERLITDAWCEGVETFA